MDRLFSLSDDSQDKAQLLQELRSVYYDFKASVVAAEVVEAGLDSEHIFFRNQSAFRRRTSKDIERISWNEQDGLVPQLIFDLNREGIYDMLPEALVHPQTSDIKAAQTQKKRSELRAQERQAREFFSPLENEFSHRSLMLDIIERELLKNNNPVRNREFFEFFFGQSNMLDDHQVQVLMHILPLCHKIRGDENLIALAISRIIGFPVEVKGKWIAKKITYGNYKKEQRSNRTLGLGMVLNDHCFVAAYAYTIEVSEVTANSFSAFMEHGKHYNVLGFITPYFFPADADVNISLNYTVKEKKLMTFGTDAICFLGFNTYI